MQPYECVIRIICPFSDVDLSYKTMDSCIEALCNTFMLGGFNEAGIGEHRLEVYRMDEKGPKLE